MPTHKPNYASKEFMPMDKLRQMLGIGKTTLYKLISERKIPAPCKFGQYIRTITKGEYEILADIKLAARDYPDDFDAVANEIIAEVKRQRGAVPDWVLESIASTHEEINNPFEVGRKKPVGKAA